MATKEQKRRRRTLSDAQRKLLTDIQQAEKELRSARLILQAETISTTRNYKALQIMGYIIRISDLHGFNHQWRITEDASEVLDE